MPSAFSLKTDVAAFTRVLKRMGGDGYAKAAAAAVNAQAKAVHHRSLRNIRERMIIRNAYTERSVKFREARAKSGGRVGYAETGSISPYLPLQETGGVIRARRRRIPIPTTGVRRGKSKRGVVISTYRLNKFGRIGGQGSKYFYMNLRKPGIFTRKGKQLLMVRDLSVSRYRLRPLHWHADAVRKFGTRAVAEQVFVREAKKQLGVTR